MRGMRPCTVVQGPFGSECVLDPEAICTIIRWFRNHDVESTRTLTGRIDPLQIVQRRISEARDLSLVHTCQGASESVVPPVAHLDEHCTATVIHYQIHLAALASIV